MRPKSACLPGRRANDIPMLRIGSNSDAGFTLIEALIAASVFAVTMTSIVGVYLSVQRLNQTSASVQILQQNGRFLIEDMTKMIRNGEIDYAKYGVGGVPQPWRDYLYVLDQDGLPVEVRNIANGLVIDRGALGSSAYHGNKIKVLDFKVYIWPATNPIPLGDYQPTVTLYFNLESNINARDRISMPFQTTVATRQYD